MVIGWDTGLIASCLIVGNFGDDGGDSEPPIVKSTICGACATDDSLSDGADDRPPGFAALPFM